MEDGWAVGGLQYGQAGLIGNLLPAASLEAWMELVDTFACYPGPHMLHDRQAGGGPLIPVWAIPGWAIVAPLAELATGTPEAMGRLRELCQSQPDSRGWTPRTEGQAVSSGKILVTDTGVRSGSYVESVGDGVLGILRETWREDSSSSWVGSVEWLTGIFTTDRLPAQWARYEEQGTCWPCNLPDFKSWRTVSCAELRPVRAFRASPRWPNQKRKCLWVWGESAPAAAPAALAHAPTAPTGDILAPAVAARLNEWWASGGKVLIATDGSLKHIRVAGGGSSSREGVRDGCSGWHRRSSRTRPRIPISQEWNGLRALGALSR